MNIQRWGEFYLIRAPGMVIFSHEKDLLFPALMLIMINGQDKSGDDTPIIYRVNPGMVVVQQELDPGVMLPDYPRQRRKPDQQVTLPLPPQLRPISNIRYLPRKA